jgi:hypothetical protein
LDHLQGAELMTYQEAQDTLTNSQATFFVLP